MERRFRRCLLPIQARFGAMVVACSFESDLKMVFAGQINELNLDEIIINYVTATAPIATSTIRSTILKLNLVIIIIKICTYLRGLVFL